MHLAIEIHRPRFAGGREPLWRNGRCVQLGVNPRYALVVDDLSPALAELIRRIDGTRTMRRLVAEAVTAGASEAEATGLLADLAAAGLIEDAEGADLVPTELAADIEAWKLRSGRTGSELLAQRSAATVEVYGSGRVAIVVAILLAASGVGRPLARPAGHVTRDDIGIGYGRNDIGHSRETAAAAAIRRHRASVGPAFETPTPDVAVVADSAVHDATLAVRLVAERVPHLAVLGLLAGSSEPSMVETTVDLDPLTGRLASRARPPHPACGCGAARIGEAQHVNRAM